MAHCDCCLKTNFHVVCDGGHLSWLYVAEIWAVGGPLGLTNCECKIEMSKMEDWTNSDVTVWILKQLGLGRWLWTWHYVLEHLSTYHQQRWQQILFVFYILHSVYAKWWTSRHSLSGRMLQDRKLGKIPKVGTQTIRTPAGILSFSPSIKNF